MRASQQQLVNVTGDSGPLYLQIYRRLRQLISEGAWPAGTRLPSSRRIALDLGISRNTALLAVDKLMADGWIVARPGSGIYVSPEAPPVRSSAKVSQACVRQRRSCTPVPFEIGQTPTDLFPVDAWRKIQNKVWAASPEDALHEGAESGWLPLRQEIASYLYAVRGLACSADQVLIVSSTQAAIDLTLRVLAKPGDGIWIEDPGDPRARQAFHSHHLLQHNLPVDDDGMDVEAGCLSAPNAKFVYVTPACQFPYCAVLSEARRSKLLDWAMEQQSYIIEADWDFNATFDGHYPATPLAARNTEQVIFIHPLDRLLFPALRITVLIVPLGMAERFLEVRGMIDGFPNVPNQMALTEFMRQGLLSAHLRRCRTAYEERRSCLHRLLKGHLGGWLEPDTKRGGLHTIAWTLRSDAAELAQIARKNGIICRNIREFMIDQEDQRSALILGFGAFRSDLLETATERLRAFALEAV